MTINEVTISRGVTISVGKFESERIDLTLRAQVDTGDNWQAVRYALQQEIEGYLKLEVQRIKGIK